MPKVLAAFAFLPGPWPPTNRLSNIDLGIIIFYLIGITLFGLSFRKRNSGKATDKSLKAYFLADNTIPWWAIALSIVSAETSTLTIISIPGVAFAGDLGFLQIVLGYMLGRIVVAALFLPRYFAGEMLTAYQLIDQRFGPTLHKVTAGLFLLTRAAAEGVRVFAISIVVGIAIGTGDTLSIGIICLLTLLYTFEGGMAAVVWTDVIQMIIYVGGTVVALYSLGSHVFGGWLGTGGIVETANHFGKFHLFNFALNLTTSYTFWAGVLGGTFLTMASHGTDQLMVQRMLAARNLKESRLALLSSGVVIFIQFTFFLLIGVGLFVFYMGGGDSFDMRSWSHTVSSDRLFPFFIVHYMPVGVAGVLIAAILAAAMSNLSAALNSLSSTTVVDFYMHLRPNADDRERAIISKSSTVFWALVLFAIAVATVSVGGKGHVVEIALSIASVAYGCLLGVFLLGTLTKYATEVGTAIGMVVGFALNVWLWQGSFPMHLGPLTIPKIAFTWYVIIGALVTFAIGSLASLVFRKQSRRNAIAVAVVALAIFLPLRGTAQEPDVAPKPDFALVSTLINEAIAAHKLPGAVLVVGHSGHVVFHQAYGNRKLAGEPGLEGTATPAEPMTEDTIFDMASLTKDLATATAVMQLYEQGKFAFDDPIEKYLPDFNPAHDPQRAQVTIRLLLTHFSGETEDLSLKDPWGLSAPDRDEGMRRALSTPLKSAPGAVFRYSDINFILLGMLVEKLSSQPEDIYVLDHIYKPLGMIHTRYLPFAQACGPRLAFGAAIHWTPPTRGVSHPVCPPGTWSTSLIPDVAPTAHDNEGTVDTNPDFDQLLRGDVHDPTTRRMGGVAGHAGLFSTAHDVSLFARALLDRLAGRPSDFPLKQSTLVLMTTPEQPGHSTLQLVAANDATRGAGANPADPLLAAGYPAIKGQDLRGYGWDIDTAFSKPRGLIFPIGSFGHTGFTGTTLWMDPGSDTYYVLLANAIHPRGNPPISNLRGEVATATARVLRLYHSADTTPTLSSRPKRSEVERPAASTANSATNSGGPSFAPSAKGGVSGEARPLSPTLTGLDVLETTHFAQLATLAKQHDNRLRIGLLTNQAGIDANRRRTIDIFATDLPKALPKAKLAALFAPEHGISGRQDTTSISDEIEPATGLHVFSLYGAKPEDRHPTHEQLKDLDAVVIDLQDAGVHFWTYEAAMGYFLEASSREKNEFHHRLDIIIIDRPNLNGGLAVQGPVSDANIENYTNYTQLPARHGMTYGELARYFNAYKLDASGKPLDAPLTVIAMQHWTRDEYFDDTHLPWINPSPNLRDPVAATLYPGIGLIEATNISVGRGTDSPFHLIGAGIPVKDAKTGEQKPAWFRGSDVAAALTARHIPGVTFTATAIPVVEDTNKYPFHGQTIEAIRFTVTDRTALDTPELGIEILTVLHRLYPEQFHLNIRFVDNQATIDALKRGEDPRTIRESWQPALDAFNARRAKVLLY